MSAHTPAPWAAHCGKAYTRVSRDSQGKEDPTGSVLICHIAGPADADLRPFNKDRWEADARLIAAAPDLLEALILLEREMVLSGNAGSTDYGWTPAIKKTSAAIARARGDTP